MISAILVMAMAFSSIPSDKLMKFQILFVGKLVMKKRAECSPKSVLQHNIAICLLVAAEILYKINDLILHFLISF